MNSGEKGVSKVIGVVILVVIVIILSIGVLFTAQTLVGDQPQDMTAGTTDERVDFYTHEAQLVNQGNTDSVYVVSPLGTKYELNKAGDLQKVLPIAKDSYSGADSYQIIGERDGQEQLLKSSHFKEGITPDVVVHDDGDKDYESIQTAINNIDDDTERDISSSNPGVIVVQEGVYKENIEVSDNINLIAEYGTVIQDANPNEDVVDIRGDNVRFQNFEVDGNPDPEDEDHYARHGINIQGDNAVVQGNTIQRANSPDVESAGVNFGGEGSVVRYNNIKDSQQSLYFESGTVGPAVCGNQFENGIGGYVSEETQRNVATLNHWNGGMPTTIAQTVLQDTDSEEVQLPENAPKDVLKNTNSRIDPSVLGEKAGRAALPFTGTKMATSEAPGECKLSIDIVHTGSSSFSLEEIEVIINGKPTTIRVVDSATYGEYESGGSRDDPSQTTDGPVAVCDCGGDGTFDPEDSISIKEGSLGEVQTYTNDGELEPLMESESDVPPPPSDFGVGYDSGGSNNDGSDSGGDSSDSSDGIEEISTSPSVDNDETSSDTEDGSQNTSAGDGTSDSSDENLDANLGSPIQSTLADEVVFKPIITGADSSLEELEYDWSLGDGTTSNEQSVSHVYDETGKYTVELTVTDPSTGETESDSTTVTVEEGESEVETIKSDEQQKLADLVEDNPDGEGQVLYLEEDTTYSSLSTISSKDLTIIGQGDGVVLDGPITVTSSGVSIKNVKITGGLTVHNNDFKLYNSEVSNSDGYAVELNTNGDQFQIGNSKLTGANGVYVGVDSTAQLTDNNIEATDTYGIYTEESVSELKISDNTLTSNDIGIYESLAVEPEYQRNDITAQTNIEEETPQDPVINEVKFGKAVTNVPVEMAVDATDPDGYQLEKITWETDGETKSLSPSTTFTHTFTNPGDYTITATVTDQFGATKTVERTITVNEFNADITLPEEASIGDEITVNVNTNAPESSVETIEYDWGDGETETVKSLSAAHKYEEIDSYDVTATVRTEGGDSKTVSGTIPIVDSPVADFNIESKLVAGEPIQFNGAYSSAPDGKSLEYQWDMGDGTTYTTESPEHTYAETGTYTVTLAVSDGDYTEYKTAHVEVDRFNVEIDKPTNIQNQVPAEFGVTTSIDESQINKYAVDFDDDGVIDKTYESAPFPHTFQEMGEHTVTVDVYDKNGAIGKDTITVNAGPAPLDPEINIANKDEKTVTVAIDEEATAPDTEITSVKWDMADGTTKTGKSVTHTYDIQGDYDVKATVTDERGETESATKTVIAKEDCKVFDEDTTLSAGTYNYPCVEITSGTTVTLLGDPSQDSSNSYGGVHIKTGGDIDVQGTLNANKRGYSYRSGPGSSSGYGEGASYGGWGGDADRGPYGSTGEAKRLGSGADHGQGGGAVWLESINGRITVSGEVTARGGDGRDAAGSGGAIRIEAPEVYGGGHLDVGGGDTTYQYGDGAGGGGRIYIDGSEKKNYNFDIDYNGGYARDDHNGQRGTLTRQPIIHDIEYSAEIGSVGYSTAFTPRFNEVDNDGVSYKWDFGDGSTSTEKRPQHTYDETGTYTVTLTITDYHGVSSTYTEEYTVEEKGSCAVYKEDTTLAAGTYEYPCLEVTSGTTLTMLGDTSKDGSSSYGGVHIKTDGKIDIKGTLDANQRGYSYRSGPGSSSGYGEGASYGGWGGAADQGPYGSTGEAKRLGSGADHGKGGGAVWLESTDDRVHVTGTITARGGNGRDAAGSGGAIRIEAPEVYGDGHLDVGGGDTTYQYGDGAGGGGRIYIDGSEVRNYNFNIDYNGGNARDDHNGQRGTLNRQPIIHDIKYSAEIGSAGYSTAFTPKFTELDNDNVNYKWDFGDGSTSTEKRPQHTYTETGVYEVSLTVTDQHGVSSTYTEEYTVEEKGSCAVYDEDTTLSAGTYEYPCLEVTSGTTLTMLGNPSQDSSDSYGGVHIKTEGDIDIQGTLNANKQGYSHRSGPGSSSGYGEGASYGGWGGDADRGPYGSAGEAKRLGSGADHGQGGGAVWLESTDGNVNVGGTVTARGGDGRDAAGSGGAIRIEAPEVYGDGHLDVGGGDTTYQYGDGAGGGGRIYIDGSEVRNYNFDIDYNGGYARDDHNGQRGTLTRQPIIHNIEYSAEIGSVGYSTAFTPKFTELDNDNVNYKWDFGDGSTSTEKRPQHTYTETGDYTVALTITDQHGVSSTYTETYEVDKKGTCAVYDKDTTLSAGTYEYPCLKVTDGTTLTMLGDTSKDSSSSYGGVHIKTEGDIDIQGTLDANQRGYSYRSGPGSSSGYGEGASYGGRGGDADRGPYGSAGEAKRLGSGADHGKGGGAVWLESTDGNVNVGGTVTARGGNGRDAAGSGGAIRIEGPTVSGSGHLDVAGGDTTYQYGDGAGGGGRIYIDGSKDRNHNFNIDYSGGNARDDHNGQRGTLNRQPVIHNIQFSSDTGSVGYDTGFTPHFTELDGDRVSYNWDFGDGSTSTQKRPVHTYDSTGTFTVTLKITDQHGVTSTYSEEYTVKEDGACAKYSRNTVLSAGTYNYPCLEVTDGTTLTMLGDTSKDGNSYGGVHIKTDGEINIQGTLDADQRGYSYRSGPGSSSGYGEGASYGGWGGDADRGPYGSAGEAKRLGSGADHGQGGGAVWLESTNSKVNIDGIINARGGDGRDAAGSGGAIRIEGTTVSGSGHLDVGGGDTTYQYGDGAGGGGRIYIGGTNQYGFNIDISGGYARDDHNGQRGTLHEDN